MGTKRLEDRNDNASSKYAQLYSNQAIIWLTLLLSLLWSMLVVGSYYWNRHNLLQEQVVMATNEARANWNKDQVFRRWATRHGGVYVRPDQRTPPNPYLSHLPKRDVVTTDGMALTLMNPAYMMSQMTREFEEEYGIKGKITGKIQLNPANAPDPWETEALDAFEKGVGEVVEQTAIEGRPYLRLMRPMVMVEGCVKCHGFLGFKVGDIRGGVSVSIPLQPYFDIAYEAIRSVRLSHLVTWLLGVSGIVAFALFARRQQTTQRKLLRRLEHDALHDYLTTMPNRLLFHDRLHQKLLQRRNDPDSRFAVCFLDLDRFKNVNDSHGHLHGDLMLIEVSKRLRGLIRPGDTIARMGGDEFTVLLGDIQNEGEAVQFAHRMLEAFREPFKIVGDILFSNVSIGICLSDDHYSDPSQMIRDADIAMYRAKAAGKGQIELFNREMHDDAKRLLLLENDIQAALAERQLELHFQPVVNLLDDRIDGFEALLRWHHPHLGSIPPDQFIPLAEESGAIIEIGEWVLRQACQQLVAWNERYSPQRPLFMSVNFSARQVIQPDIATTVARILNECNMPPTQLHCEVTETVVIEHTERAAESLSELRALGVETSIDDFGKGYSSLTYLHQFDFDLLKIDKQFIQDMEGSGKGLQLVRTIMLLARDLDMEVIAEGIEEQQQCERLKSLRCHWGQGYLFARPQPAREIESLLQQSFENACGHIEQYKE